MVTQLDHGLCTVAGFVKGFLRGAGSQRWTAAAWSPARRWWLVHGSRFCEGFFAGGRFAAVDGGSVVSREALVACAR